MTKIKICGLSRDEDIDYVNEYCPDYIGFIIGFPKSHRNITLECAKKLRARLREEIEAVGVFVNADIKDIVEARACGAIDMVQLHGDEDNNYISELKESLTQSGLSTEIIKAIQIKSDKDIDFAKSSDADMILFDAGMGEGKLLPESILENLKSVKRPFLFAGGLDAKNVTKVMEKLHPYGVDVSSKVESDQKKDRAKIAEFIKNIRYYDECEWRK